MILKIYLRQNFSQLPANVDCPGYAMQERSRDYIKRALLESIMICLLMKTAAKTSLKCCFIIDL